MSDKQLFDNTRLSDYRSCPRFYFCRHKMDLVPDKISMPLVFGLGWHEGLDEIWKSIAFDNITDISDLTQKAITAFMKVWESSDLPSIKEMTRFGIDDDLQKHIGFRNPTVAIEMFAAYVSKRIKFIRSVEVQAIEEPFLVPLDPKNPNLFYIGRRDKRVRDGEGIRVIEHKTSSEYAKSGGFRSTFTDSFSPNSQVDGYCGAGVIEFGPDVFKGVYVDAALVHKDFHDIFKFIPVDRSPDHLESWLWEVHNWIERINQDEDNLKKEITSFEERGAKDKRNTFLRAFPKNTQSCRKYGAACPYLGLCKSWANPLHLYTQFEEGCPPGYKTSPWKPEEIHLKEES